MSADFWRERYPDDAAKIDRAMDDLLLAIGSLLVHQADAMELAAAVEECVGVLRSHSSSNIESSLDTWELPSDDDEE